jgi:hypothetical protein
MLVKPNIIANMLVRNIDAAPNQSRTGCGANQRGLASYPLVVKRQLLPLANPASLMRFAMALPSPNEFRQNGLCNFQNRALNIGTSGFEVLPPSTLFFNDAQKAGSR